MSQHNTGRKFEESSSGTRQVKQGAKEAVSKVKEQASSAVGQQKDVAAQKLESVGKAFRQSAEGLNEGSIPAIGTLLENAADSVESLAQSIRDGDFRSVVDNIEDWARRHPAVFLGGALVTGLFVARFLKSSREKEFGAYDTGPSTYGEGEFESELAGAGVSQYGGRQYGTSRSSPMGQYSSGSTGSGDVKPGMTVPGTTPGQAGPVEPSSAWEEQ